MNRHRLELILGTVLLLLTAATALWQHPGLLRAPLAAEEIEHYAAALQALPVPATEREQLIAKARRFMTQDDGRPVYMLNLMRFHPELRRYDGAPDFDGTPQQSNARYEDVAIPLLLKRGGFPMYAGSVHEPNLLGSGPRMDDWHRVLLVRYPSRRSFMQLLSDPAYAPIAPYKLMALELVLTPSQSEFVVPPLTGLVAMLSLLVFLATGWLRAARRR